MNTERKYPIGYRPDIYSASITLEYYDIKYLNHPSQKRFTKKIHLPFTIIILDDNKEIPENLKPKLIKQKYRKATSKKDYNNYIINIKDIEIINHHGKVSYDFDEFSS